MKYLPDFTLTSPARVFINVDLPQPFGPMIVNYLSCIDSDGNAMEDVGLAIAGHDLRRSSNAKSTAPEIGVDYLRIRLHLQRRALRNDRPVAMAITGSQSAISTSMSWSMMRNVTPLRRWRGGCSGTTGT